MMELLRAVGHFLNWAILWGVELANLVTVVPLVLLLVGTPCIILFYWFRGLFIRE